jgi:hypothetical protein
LRARAASIKARVIDHLGRRAPFWGGPNVLLVLGARTVGGSTWVRVLFKHPPAEAGDAGRVRWRSQAVVGAPATPSPTGLFAVDAAVRQPSHGCIRLPDGIVRRLLRSAPRGTPVLIRP